MATKQTEIETQHGKPLADVLVELYEKHGNVKAVADELGITSGMVSYFVRACGLCFKTILVERTSYYPTPKGLDYLRDMRDPSMVGNGDLGQVAGVSK